MSDNVLNISYSKIYGLPYPMNTAELYKEACKLGFDAIKGDVTPCSDGKLIMCHDNVFRLDENGRVLEPWIKEGICGETYIDKLTYEECKNLEYASEAAKEHLGYYAHVAELEEMIKTCREYGKIAYITVRDQQIEWCVDEIYRLLTKYDMVNQCIINSFTPETLQSMRRKDKNIRLSRVFGPDETVTKAEIDICAELGNCAFCFFSLTQCGNTQDVYDQSKEAFLYAKEKGVPLHFAQVADKKFYNWGLENGFVGFQCLTVKTCF